MYGSSFWMVTRIPRACKSFAREAEIIPLPKLEETPPVTKMYLVAWPIPYVCYTGYNFTTLFLSLDQISEFFRQRFHNAEFAEEFLGHNTDETVSGDGEDHAHHAAE